MLDAQEIQMMWTICQFACIGFALNTLILFVLLIDELVTNIIQRKEDRKL